MANKNRVQIVSRWVENGNAWEPEVLPIIAALGNGIAVTDVTGQSDESIPPTPNIYIVEVDNLTAAQLAALKANPKAVVLQEEVYDDADLKVISHNKSGVLNAGQMNALKTQIKAAFADVKDADLNLRGGNRGAIVNALKRDLQRLPKNPNAAQLNKGKP